MAATTLSESGDAFWTAPRIALVSQLRIAVRILQFQDSLAAFVAVASAKGACFATFLRWEQPHPRLTVDGIVRPARLIGKLLDGPSG